MIRTLFAKRSALTNATWMSGEINRRRDHTEIKVLRLGCDGRLTDGLPSRRIIVRFKSGGKVLAG